MAVYTGNLSIKQWAEEDQPRERLLKYGRSVMSDAELIAILIRSGSAEESAVELAKRILKKVDNNLNDLGKMSVHDLKQLKGMGEVKALSIVAALELGRRRKEQEKGKEIKITSSNDAYQYINSRLADLPHEEFWVLILNRANTVLSAQLISRGGVSGTVADIRIIFKHAIENLASSIIVCHNHPSGNLTPSSADIALTKKLVETGKVMEIPVLDHIIVGDNDFYSFADNSKI